MPCPACRSHAALALFLGLGALLFAAPVAAERISITQLALQEEGEGTGQQLLAAQLLASLEHLASGDVTLELLRQKLPYDTSKASRAVRRKLFNQADGNGNGILSLAEIDKMVRDELAIGYIGPSGIAPVLMRAYQVARNYQKGMDMSKVTGMAAAMALDKSSIYEATVDRREFRVLLEYIHKYFSIYQVFKEVDTSFDGRIDEAEFGAAQEKGAIPADMSFADVDADGGGMVLFDEFAAYAIATGGLGAEADGEDDA